MRCTKAVIYRENIINNLMQVKSVLKPHTKICVAVKADGYGTSALETAKIASSLDIDYLAVATIDEAKTLDNIETPCSVKTFGVVGECLSEANLSQFAISSFSSSLVSLNIKSSGNLFRFLFTASFNLEVDTS